MTLAPGTRLGPYETLSKLGEGGMGVVYQAKDTRLGRDVAIKMLPKAFAEDADRLRRFEQEAKAIGRLNHPNILSAHDMGLFEGSPYLVMELLEGETLRAKMSGKPIPPKRAVEYTLQIANGLAAAHEQGIIHRDLKPDNVFITKDGRVKILDFGLAKSTQKPLGQEEATEALTTPLLSPGTAVGTVVGTVGYMSPEQVRGDKLDGRSDLFCLGVILWEMVTGKHPFHGPSAIETMHAILKDEPPELSMDLKLPPLLEKVLHSCLSKDPSGRFHSAHDLAFALEASTLSSNLSVPGLKAQRWTSPGTKHPALWAGLGAACVLLCVVLAWGMSWPPFKPNAAPTFKRLTFAPGILDTAFFSADGRSIFFCARFQGQKPEIFVQTPESPEPRSLDTQGAVLLGVSSTNELAILREARALDDGFRGTLARMPGGGGASRDLQEDVEEAAWDSSGQNFAMLISDQGFNSHLEYPAGKRLYSSIGTLKLLRVSKSGNQLALVEGTGSQTNVLVVDPKGQRRVLMSKDEDTFAATLTGLAWHPNGSELWVSEWQGDQTVLWSLNLRGKRRMVWRGPGAIKLLDLAPDGRVLATVQQTRRGVFYQRAGESMPRDLSILDGTQALSFMPDGKTLLMMESPAVGGGTTQDLTYLRKTDGSPALRLAKGYPRSVSPDGKYVGLSLYDSSPNAPGNVMSFTPTGAGLPITVQLSQNFVGLDDGLLFQNAQKVLFAGMEKDKDWQFYTVEVRGGTPKAFTPVGVRAPRPLLLSPDGKYMIGSTTTRGQFVRYPLDGGTPLPIKGLQTGETPVAWTQDGQGIYITGRETDLPVKLLRLDPATGQRRPVSTFMPPDTAGYLGTLSVCVTPDASAFAYTYNRKLSDLYLIEGLK